MATQASSKPLGTAPEPFDGKANNTETFWSNLANYYYLNDGMFSDESRKVSAALTHFKLGTPARDWAQECTNEALKKMPIIYGSWNDFKKAFMAHFIPAELVLEASTIMHSLRQGNCPFNEWYQEWSSHAPRTTHQATRTVAPASHLKRTGGESTQI
jgi:Retrotransposon gag protein